MSNISRRGFLTGLLATSAMIAVGTPLGGLLPAKTYGMKDVSPQGPDFVFKRASVAPYRDSNGNWQLAGIDEPRFDHDENGNFLGLLIEEGESLFVDFRNIMLIA